MSEQRVAPYGSWKSPITSELAGSAAQLTEVAVHGDETYWRELRPEEQGRFTIMKREGREGYCAACAMWHLRE